MDDRSADRASDKQGKGCGPAFAEPIGYAGLFVAWWFLPYTLLLLPVGVFLIWYYWRPRKLQISLAAMFWVVTFLIVFYDGFIILIMK